MTKLDFMMFGGTIANDLGRREEPEDLFEFLTLDEFSDLADDDEDEYSDLLDDENQFGLVDPDVYPDELMYLSSVVIPPSPFKK